MGTVFGMISVESAAFEVEKQLTPNIQIRRYKTCVYVETPIGNGGLSSSESSAAFQRLAQYLGVFGTPLNESQIPIAMTAPVVRARAIAEKVAMTAPVVNTAGTMAFVLPAKYQSVDAAPRPLDPRVKLRAGMERKCAVLTFAGYATDAVVSDRVAELSAKLVQYRFKPMNSKFEVLRYNPPFTIPMLRTNEILIEVSP